MTDHSLETYKQSGEVCEFVRTDEGAATAVELDLTKALYGGAAVGFAAALWWVGDKLAGLMISGGW